jgi:hypothetical protein
LSLCFENEPRCRATGIAVIKITSYIQELLNYMSYEICISALIKREDRRDETVVKNG